ncbi:MAG: hypothetical protein ACI97B_001401 [Verrucomicrobiales bacterium]|jgi:hypothetical protein
MNRLVIHLCCLLICGAFAAQAQQAVPGFTKFFVAGVAPDGDDDAIWEDSLDTINFNWGFSGAQAPLEVSDAGMPNFTQAYVFPAAAATTTGGSTLGSGQDTSFELWFRPTDLIGNHVLFELGGNGNGTSVLLEADRLHFFSQTGSANQMQTTITLPPDAAGRFHQLVAVIDFLAAGAGDNVLYLNGGALSASNHFASGYTNFAGSNGSGLGQANSTYSGDSVYPAGTMTPFNGEIAAFRFYQGKAIDAADVLQNFLEVSASPPRVDLFTVSPVNVSSGALVSVSWAVQDATSVMIEPGIGAVVTNGSTNVTVDVTTLFQLTASNAVGNSSAYAQATVDGALFDLVITEFMASNDSGLEDGDGASSDWIEVYNPNGIAVDMAGWRLTDSTLSTKWIAPMIILPARGYVILFASGQTTNTYVDGAGYHHTNFKLDADGEYLALLNPSGTTVQAYAPMFPPQEVDFSYGTAAGGAVGYFADPTPGTANDSSFEGIVSDTKFSVDRGFYSNAFTVAITSATADVEIRYTLDFTTPTATNGLIYTNPIPIQTTTLLRAAAFRPGWFSTDVDTQTYIFPADVMSQPANPPGWPTTWAGVVADYEMDPDVIGVSNLFTNVYRNTIVDDLQAIPTISIVTEMDNLFGATGMYDNPLAEGVGWERPASVELIHPDGRTGFQINCGLRIQGGSGRNPDIPKHNFRLLFKKDYGPGKLVYKLFKDQPASEGATDTFDTLILRAHFNNSWTHRHWYQCTRAQYVRDQFMRDSQNEMAHPSPHGMYAHLYINGLYWGLYNPSERPSAPFMAEYYGGKREDFDAQNVNEAVDGDLSAWNTMMALANAGVTAETAYTNILQYLDATNLADYMLLNFFTGNDDWDGHNWYAGRKREPGAGYQFFSWDAELSISVHQGTPPAQPDFNQILSRNKTGINAANKPSRLHQKLAEQAEYRILFADRVQKHFFNDGVLTTERNLRRWLDRRDQVHPAVVAESARWGDFRRDVNPGAYTPADFDLFHRDKHYDPYQEWIIGTYFPQRRDIFLNQLKAKGLWLDMLAPDLSSQGGIVPLDFQVSMTNLNSSGTIYYTLDGNDPRESFTSLPSGLPYTESLGLTNVNTTVVKARVLSTNDVWSPLIEATFTVPPDDTDLDGLSDAWEVTYFTNLSQTAEADYDGDGLSNGQEAFVGTHPRDAASVFMVVPYQSTAGMMTLEVTATTRRIRVEVSIDLSSWSEVQDYTVLANRIELVLEPSARRRYFRVLAE